MPHRMEIELTSARDPESFTWRAAGAREPKGVVPSSLLPSGAKVGDVVRVEAEVELDGISIVSVLPSKEKAPVKGVIEVKGSERPTPGVTTVLAGKSREGRSKRDGIGVEPGRARRRPERRPRHGTGEEGPGGDARTVSDRRPPSEHRDTGEKRPEPGRRLRTRPAAGEHDRGARRPRERTRADAADATGRESRGPQKRGPVRLEPGTKHRDELFASLSAEQRPIAERLASGGLPALRKAISEEQQRAKAEGRPVVSGDPLIAVAEQLMPGVQGAVWLDRAEAAVERLDEISLRDLRTAVAGAAPRDEAARELQRRLREGLERRVTKLRAEWENHIRQAVEDGRVLQALRLSGRPPEPTARFPAALVEPLVAHASEAMSADTAPDRWLALLEAAVASPVRRQIKPSGIPKDETGEVERQARLAAGRVPALAALLGMAMPPPPLPLSGERAPSRQSFPARAPRSRRGTATRRVAPPKPAPSSATVSREEPASAPAGVVSGEAVVDEPVVAGPVVDEPVEVVSGETAVDEPTLAGPAVDEPVEFVSAVADEPSLDEPVEVVSGEAVVDEPVEQAGDEA